MHYNGQTKTSVKVYSKVKGEFSDIVLLTQTGDRDVKTFEDMS